MRWKRFLGRLAIGLVAIVVATSFAIVPPTALPGLLAEVDRSQRIGITVIYVVLLLTVVIYAFLDSRKEPAEGPKRP